MLRKWADFSNLYFRSNIGKVNRLATCNKWKKVTLCVHQRCNKFMFNKTKNKNKKYFCRSCLQCFSSKNVLTKHKEDCLSINGAQSVKLEKGTIDFKNCFKKKQSHLVFLLILCLIYTLLKFMKGSTQKNIKITFFVVLLTSLFVLMINLPNQ